MTLLQRWKTGTRKLNMNEESTNSSDEKVGIAMLPQSIRSESTKIPREDSNLVENPLWKGKKEEISTRNRKRPKKQTWEQVTTDDGQIYYYNKETNETAWKPP